MLFQTLDDKEECIGICIDGKLYYNKIPSNLTKTWNCSESLKNIKNIKYAQLFCKGKSLEEVCPEHLKKDWNEVNHSLKAFYRALRTSKISLTEHCFYELVPPQLLIEYCQMKDQISMYVFDNYEKPKNYNTLLKLAKIFIEIKNRKLNVDFSGLNDVLHTPKARNFFKKNKKIEPIIKYNQFKTKTGRLSTDGAFPILTMDKAYRKIIKPNNDWFLEFDYNAAELRVMLALLGKEQPSEDLHNWNLKNVYKGLGTREEAKKRIFAWLYNPESKDYLSNREYNRDKLLTKYWNGTCIKTYFNREIKADKHHALNYIIQSTAADLFFHQMIKVWEKLQNKKSYIAFCMHDSLIIDFAKEDQDILIDLKKIFQETEVGQFIVNIRAGQNYGNMKQLNI